MRVSSLIACTAEQRAVNRLPRDDLAMRPDIIPRKLATGP
jgi:hypothetical protein